MALKWKIPKDRNFAPGDFRNEAIGIHGTNHIIAKTHVYVLGYDLNENTAALFLNSSLLGQQHNPQSATCSAAAKQSTSYRQCDSRKPEHCVCGYHVWRMILSH